MSTKCAIYLSAYRGGRILALIMLKENGFIDVKKTGACNVYLVNKNLVWKSWGNNYKYAEFGAKIIISLTEQEQLDETKVKTRKQTVAEIKNPEES